MKSIYQHQFLDMDGQLHGPYPDSMHRIFKPLEVNDIPAGIPSETMGMRLKRLRKARGLTLEALSQSIGVGPVAISRWESGVQNLRANNIKKLSDALGVSTQFLQYGGAGGPQIIPVTGMVGAGQSVVPFDDAAHIGEIEAPYGTPPGTRALEVRGDSMLPMFPPGTVLFYRPITQRPEDLIKQLCIVQLEDGRVLVKRLRAGREYATFDLESTNAEPIEGVRLVNCCKVEGVKF